MVSDRSAGNNVCGEVPSSQFSVGSSQLTHGTCRTTREAKKRNCGAVRSSLLCLRGETNSSQRVVARGFVGGASSRHLSAARVVLAGVDRGCSVVDRAAADTSGRSAAGGRRCETRSGIAVAGIFARVSVRHFVVRRDVLLGLRHHASLWRAAGSDGGFSGHSVLPVHRALSRLFRISGGVGRRPRINAETRAGVGSVPVGGGRTRADAGYSLSLGTARLRANRQRCADADGDLDRRIWPVF